MERFIPTLAQKKEFKDFYSYCRSRQVDLKNYIEISRMAYDYIQDTGSTTLQALLAMSAFIKRRGHSISKIISNDFFMRSHFCRRP